MKKIVFIILCCISSLSYGNPNIFSLLGVNWYQSEYQQIQILKERGYKCQYVNGIPDSNVFDWHSCFNEIDMSGEKWNTGLDSQNAISIRKNYGYTSFPCRTINTCGYGSPDMEKYLIKKYPFATKDKTGRCLFDFNKGQKICVNSGELTLYKWNLLAGPLLD